MKKALFILSTVLLFSILSSCSKVDDAVDSATVKKNWIFTITAVTTTVPDFAGPQSIVTTVEKQNLTEVEAEAARLVIVSENPGSTQSAMGLTVTITVTVTKAEKK
jgi:hypothetical protein